MCAGFGCGVTLHADAPASVLALQMIGCLLSITGLLLARDTRVRDAGDLRRKASARWFYVTAGWSLSPLLLFRKDILVMCTLCSLLHGSLHPLMRSHRMLADVALFVGGLVLAHCIHDNTCEVLPAIVTLVAVIAQAGGLVLHMLSTRASAYRFYSPLMPPGLDALASHAIAREEIESLLPYENQRLHTLRGWGPGASNGLSANSSTPSLTRSRSSSGGLDGPGTCCPACAGVIPAHHALCPHCGQDMS